MKIKNLHKHSNFENWNSSAEVLSIRQFDIPIVVLLSNAKW